MAEPSPSFTEWLRRNTVFVVLTAVFAAGLVITAYLTVKDEYVPNNEKTVIVNGTHMFVIFKRTEPINIPIKSFFEPEPYKLTLQYYFKREYVNPGVLNSNIAVQNISLSANSSSILTLKSPFGKATERGGTYSTELVVGHPLNTGLHLENYVFDMFYLYT
jgi:hypothetical protein